MSMRRRFATVVLAVAVVMPLGQVKAFGADDPISPPATAQEIADSEAPPPAVPMEAFTETTTDVPTSEEVASCVDNVEVGTAASGARFASATAAVRQQVLSEVTEACSAPAKEQFHMGKTKVVTAKDVFERAGTESAVPTRAASLALAGVRVYYKGWYMTHYQLLTPPATVPMYIQRHGGLLYFTSALSWCWGRHYGYKGTHWSKTIIAAGYSISDAKPWEDRRDELRNKPLSLWNTWTVHAVFKGFPVQWGDGMHANAYGGGVMLRYY